MSHRRSPFSSFLRSTLASAWLLPFAGLLASACATAPAVPNRSAELERNMVELRASNAGYLRQIDELQNRIFILENKIENTLRVAEDNRRAGPISRTLVEEDARPDTDRAPARPVARPVAQAANVVQDPNGAEVEYAGEAAQPTRRGGARPSLRLSGNGRAVITSVAVNEPAREPSRESTRQSTRDSARMTPKEAHAAVSLYRQGLEEFRSGHDAAAIATFRKFLKNYPQHHYGDNAQFALGECYYDLRQYRAAVRELRLVGERYPHGNKVPDAMLKLGEAQLALGDASEARGVLEALVRMYPRHAASQLAVERLDKAGDKVSSHVTLGMNGR
jgi:tol-pal system protein YbgF